MLLTSLFEELTLTILGTESSELQSKGGFSSYFVKQLDSFGSDGKGELDLRFSYCMYREALVVRSPTFL